MLFRIIAGLWVVWGLVHILAGVMVMSSGAQGGLQAIGDAVSPETLEQSYPQIVGGVLNQHGWNLAWFGLFTVIGGAFIWREARQWIWPTALIGGLADAGYFMFIDLPGFANFVPGTVMTLVSGAAILLSVVLWRSTVTPGADA